VVGHGFAGDAVYSMIRSVDDVEAFFPAIGVETPSSETPDALSRSSGLVTQS
jgi:hypothetical protein